MLPNIIKNNIRKFPYNLFYYIKKKSKEEINT